MTRRPCGRSERGLAIYRNIKHVDALGGNCAFGEQTDITRRGKCDFGHLAARCSRRLPVSVCGREEQPSIHRVNTRDACSLGCQTALGKRRQPPLRLVTLAALRSFREMLAPSLVARDHDSKRRVRQLLPGFLAPAFGASGCEIDRRFVAERLRHRHCSCSPLGAGPNTFVPWNGFPSTVRTLAVRIPAISCKAKRFLLLR